MVACLNVCECFVEIVSEVGLDVEIACWEWNVVFASDGSNHVVYVLCVNETHV